MSVEFVLKFNGSKKQHEAILVGSIPQVRRLRSVALIAQTNLSFLQLGKGNPEDGLKLNPSPAGLVWKNTVDVS